MPIFTSYSNFSDPNASSGGTVATAINNAGEVVGYYTNNHGAEHGFIYEDGKFRTITDPNAGKKGTTIVGINASGQIVGNY
jgi:probable HAF family extracellular repeat protein